MTLMPKHKVLNPIFKPIIIQFRTKIFLSFPKILSIPKKKTLIAAKIVPNICNLKALMQRFFSSVVIAFGTPLITFSFKKRLQIGLEKPIITKATTKLTMNNKTKTLDAILRAFKDLTFLFLPTSREINETPVIPKQTPTASTML
uniref:Uncharacterized protein n=1 Tax=Onion yellows phytoplasma OY-W TaxID=428984 RepID=A6QKR3_ONYPH|nr:hypothetical protein [Onion yellows phytoplasma OY-W]